MSSSSVGNRAAHAVCGLLLCGAGYACADTLILAESTLYGHVVSVGPDNVVMMPGCTEPTQTIRKADVQRIILDTQCEPHPIEPYSAGVGLCPGPTRSVIELRFAGPPSTVLASDFQIKGSRLHFVSADGTLQSHGPIQALVSATRSTLCAESLVAGTAPESFCTEGRAWAVNFGSEPLLGNTILTRGISFYLEDDNGKPISDPTIGTMIRSAFGTAMTGWIGALNQNREQMPAPVIEVLDHLISRSSHFALLLPPQVVEMGCPDTAMFVIRFATHSEAGLVDANGLDRKAARAEVAGRTVLINGVHYPCWVASAEDRLQLDDQGVTHAQCINLSPVLVHELGHAFGISGHLDDPQHRSIMDSTLTPALLRPTSDDARNLAQVLMQPIAGAPAGRLDADALGVSIRLTP